MSAKWIAAIGWTFVLLLLLYGAFSQVISPWIAEKAMRSKAKNNVFFLMHALKRDGARSTPGLYGRNFLLQCVASGAIKATSQAEIRTGLFPLDTEEEVLANLDLSEYERLTLEALKTQRFPHLCGFAGPAASKPPWDGPRPLIGDLTSEDGAIIGFSDGSVRWIERDELGLGDGDPMLCGPASKSPLLRMLSDE